MAHHVLHVDREHRRAGAGRPDQRARPHRRLHPHQARRQGAGPPAQRAAACPPSSCTATSARTPAPATWTPFHSGTATTLVATDIAARGIHVDDVALVVHADPPVEHKAYLHRSGRTARAGAAGTVVTLMTDDQVRDVRDLTRKAGIKPTTTRIQPRPPAAAASSPPASASFAGGLAVPEPTSPARRRRRWPRPQRWRRPRHRPGVAAQRRPAAATRQRRRRRRWRWRPPWPARPAARHSSRPATTYTSSSRPARSAASFSEGASRRSR